MTAKLQAAEEEWGEEEADFLVCVLFDGPVCFDDDIRDLCSKCGIAVRLRPYSPVKPARICVHCMFVVLHEAAAQ